MFKENQKKMLSWTIKIMLFVEQNDNDFEKGQKFQILRISLQLTAH